ncbi:MAG: DUF481 domain-containing protein [Myxococcota bacterium]
MLWWISALAWGQVNAEDLADKAGSPGLAGDLSARGAFFLGNLDLVDVEGVARGHWTRVDPKTEALRTRLLAQISGALRTLAGRRLLDQRLIHLRATHFDRARFGPDVFAQLNNDVIRLLRWRAVGGVGVSARPFVFDAWEVGFGTAYMAEFEDRNVTDEPRQVLNHRWSTYVSWTAQLHETFSWTNTVYVQPRFDRFADLQVLNETAVRFAVAKWLSYVTTVQLRVDTEPPMGVVPVDARFIVGLMLHGARPPHLRAPL